VPNTVLKAAYKTPYVCAEKTLLSEEAV